MNRLIKSAVLVGVGVLCLNGTEAFAQGGGGGGGGRGNRGNFDPAQMQQRMAERIKEQLEIKDDAELKVIQPLVQKVMEARMATFGGRGMGGRRGGGGGDQGASANPEYDALQRAIESKGSNAELKAAIAKYVESRKAKQAALEKAQADLRKLLSVRQEAIATREGWL